MALRVFGICGVAHGYFEGWFGPAMLSPKTTGNNPVDAGGLTRPAFSVTATLSAWRKSRGAFLVWTETAA